MNFEIGDEVSFEAPEADCVSCEIFKPVLYPDSHFVLTEHGVPRGFVCSICADTEEKRQIPISMVSPVVDQVPLVEPVTGAFAPIPTQPDPMDSGAYQYWMWVGHMILETMVMWQGKLLKLSLSSQRYKGLWIKPHWDGRTVIGFSIAGDTPSKKLELDVYQLSRLKQLGFTETGKTNKVWTIDLLPIEGNIHNSSAIVVHLVRHGYLLEPSDLNSITPTLDIDFSDPKYQELKNGERAENEIQKQREH